MKDNNRILIGAVVLIVLAALSLWWISSGMPLNIPPLGIQPATTTTATTTGGTKAPITRTSRSSTDIVSIIAGLSGASQFNTQFKATGVAASISATGKYTIFVPTNGAFAQLPAGTISNMTTAEKKRLVQYHIMPGRAIDVDTFVAGMNEAMSKDMLNFSFGTNKIPMVNSAIIIAEYTGKNGVVYLIDNVLLPPKKAGI